MIGAASYLASTRQYFYSLPYSREYDLAPIEFFRRAIQRVAPRVLDTLLSNQEPENTDQIYGCARKGICLTLENALAQYAESDINLINDPYVFYEIIQEALQRGRAEIDQLVFQGSFLYEAHMARLRSDARQKISEYEQIMSNLLPISLAGASPASRFSPYFLNLYRRFVAKVVRGVDLMTSLLEIEKIMLLLNELYPQDSYQLAPLTEDLLGPTADYRYVEVPQQEIEPIRATIPDLNQYLASIQDDLVILAQLDARNLLAQNQNASWLYEKLPTIPVAVTLF